MAAVLDICSAPVGLDLTGDHLDAVTDAFSFTSVAASSHQPAVWYRRRQPVAPRAAFERHDTLRDRKPPPIVPDIDTLIDDLHLTVALHARSLVFIHAGVVAIGQHALLLPGRSRAGKSTLVQRLVDAGATYLSDEFACLRPDGMIEPYARPIHLRTSQGRALVTPNRVATGPVHPAVVLYARHVVDTDFDPTVVNPAASALELLNNMAIAQTRPQAATDASARLARATIAYRSDRPDADDATVAKVLHLLENRSR